MIKRDTCNFQYYSIKSYVVDVYVLVSPRGDSYTNPRHICMLFFFFLDFMLIKIYTGL